MKIFLKKKLFIFIEYIVDKINVKIKKYKKKII